jgi:hypothetical protein
VTIQLDQSDLRNWSVPTNHTCFKKIAPEIFTSESAITTFFKLQTTISLINFFKSSLGELSCRIQTPGYEIAGNFLLRPLEFVS